MGWSPNLFAPLCSVGNTLILNSPTTSMRKSYVNKKPRSLAGLCILLDGFESEFGGARRDRTADLYNAIVALSQLSYGPRIWKPQSTASPRVLSS